MADTYNKKEREKKRAQKKKEKQERKEERKASGKQTELIMYVDYNGNFTENKPEDIPPSDLDELMQEKAPASDPEIKRGTIKFFDDEKGFGFIKTNGKLGDVYFTADDAPTGLSNNTQVEFKVERSKKGYQAFEIKKT